MSYIIHIHLDSICTVPAGVRGGKNDYKKVHLKFETYQGSAIVLDRKYQGSARVVR